MAALNSTISLELHPRQVDVTPASKVWVEYPATLAPGQIGIIKDVIAEWSGLPIASVLVLHAGAKLHVLTKENEGDACTSDP